MDYYLGLLGALSMFLIEEGNQVSNLNVYYLILVTYFVIALGFSLQQISANPFAISLGDPDKGSNRLNLAGGVNSFGTMIAPLVFYSFRYIIIK